MKLCVLCCKNEAGSQKSHIIPKFFTNSIYWINGQNQKGKTIKFVNKIMGESEENWQQDLLKEANLFCGDCEKYFELLDTHFCNTIYMPFRNQEQLKSYFRIAKIKNTIAFCEKANEYVISLFIGSILFRCHVSSLEFCRNFCLSTEEFDCVRDLLIAYKSEKGNELISKVQVKPMHDKFSYLIFTYANNSAIESRKNIVDTNYKSKVGWYYLLINDYVLTVYFNEANKGFTDAINTNKEKVKMVILSDTEYRVIQNMGFERYYKNIVA